MARQLTAATETASQASLVRPVWLAELAFDSGTERVTTAPRDLIFQGNTFSALGDFGGVTTMRESSDLSADGVTLRLSGVPTARISEALTEQVQGRTAKLWIGFLDSAYQLIADPAGPFTFRMDAFEVQLGDTAEISLTCESRAILWRQSAVRRYTDQDQQAAYPGDRFFEFVPQMAEKEIVWPSAAGAAASQVSAPAPRPSPSAGTRSSDDDTP